MPQKENITRILSRTTPLCFLSEGLLLCYKRGKIVVMKDGQYVRSFPVLIRKSERLLGCSRLASRLFRFGVRSAIAIDAQRAILSIGNRLYEIDVTSGIMTEGWDCGTGIRPLFFSEVKGIDTFKDGIYFGGYLGNMGKEPVNIYCRTGVDNWETVYTFPKGAINHIHNVVPDPYRNCLWVFTGDFDEAAAVWKVTDGFDKVERVAFNDQRYRACAVFALPEGLLYATDAPFMDDFIYLFNPETMDTKELFPIYGSCIYGCKWKQQYVFSSTVEGDGRNMSRMEFFFGRKRGNGIKDNFVHMYVGNLQDGFKELYKEEKDFLPYYTFQFGVFKFPSGINNTDTLFFQPIATKKNDNALLALNL